MSYHITYQLMCNDGRTFFKISDGQSTVPLEITDWPIEKVEEFYERFKIS